MHSISTFLIICVVLCTSSLFVSTLANDDNEIGYFWHITDPHVDFFYKQGSEVDCGKLMCCRHIVPHPKKKAGKFGDLECDPPISTFSNALRFIKNNDIKPDFIFYGGDSVPHDLWMQNRTYNLEYIRAINDAFLDVFGTKTPVINVLGNHDTFPVDQTNPKDSSWTWLFQPVADWWSVWLPLSAVRTLREKGWYSIQSFMPGLSIICLNTQYEDPLNFYLYENLTDPAGQLDWLDKELGKAKQLGNKVFLFGHIPPGQKDSSYEPYSLLNYNEVFNKIVEKYSNIIKIQLYGHSHKDSFRVFTDAETGKTPTGSGLITPAITPWKGHNPAFRLIKYSRKTFDIMDATNFYADIEQSNKDGKLEWKKEYSMRDAYGLKNITNEEMFSLTKKLWYNDDILAKFLKYYESEGDKRDCTGTCRVLQVCATRHVEIEQYQKCVEQLSKQTHDTHLSKNQVKQLVNEALNDVISKSRLLHKTK